MTQVNWGKPTTDGLDKFIQTVGKVASWSTVLVMLCIIGQVVLRYAFASNLPLLDELEWHFYATGFLLGISYAVCKDVNIRVDLLHKGLPQTTKNWLDFAGIIFLLLPFSIIIFYHSIIFAAHSWTFGERSLDPLGLPYRWLIKSVIPVSFGLLILAGLTRLMQVLKRIRRGSHGNL